MSYDKRKDVINILGINLDKLENSSLWQEIDVILKNDEQHYLVTPNPEIVLAAQNDEELFFIINNAKLIIPDGVGLKFAAWLLGENIKRYTGADISMELLSKAEKEEHKVAIFNWEGGLSSAGEISKALKDKFPQLNFIVEDIAREWSMPYYQSINIFKPQIIFVGLGSPWQEKFIYHNLKKMPYVKLALGIGGSFDFISGARRRAPNMWRKLGLEWLWRLGTQFYNFKRWQRIFNAVVIFPCKVFKWRFVLPFFYRSNVSCLVYKEVNGKKYILLLKRADEENHWQFVQGGRDGLSIEEAGLKELSEELGSYKFKPVAVFPGLYKYKFPASNSSVRHRGSVYKRHTGYKGQKQGFLICLFYGSDDDIKINYWDHSDWKWVEESKVLDAVHPLRKEAVSKIMKKFKELEIEKDKL